MKPAPTPSDREPNTGPCPSAPHFDAGIGELSSCTTLTYFVEERPTLFNFVHDKSKGLVSLTKADGTVEHFRDKPTRYLVVEPDSSTGEPAPTVKAGLPVYLYLCREEREHR